MARQVLPIVGAVVGAWVTGGSPQGAQIGFAIGSCEGEAVEPAEANQADTEETPA